MTTRSDLSAAFWPAMLGVLAAHQIGYAGHDDGHIHGYLETVGPALVAAAVLAWIWSWARSRVEFRAVLGLQAGLFAVMEIVERLTAGGGFTVSDLAPIAIAVALIPLLAGLTVLADRVLDLVRIDAGRPSSSGLCLAAVGATSVSVSLGVDSNWAIRGPPSFV